MPMNTDSCERVHEFVDGHLDEEPDRRFRAHLASCARCQAELHDILQLKMAMDQLRQHRGKLLRFRRVQRYVAAAAVAACAASVGIALWPAGPEPLAAFVARSGERPIQVRLSPDAADVYR